jgi:hypothetical protein
VKRRDGIREKPKQKAFIRGGFWYNPEISTEVWRGCRSECTAWIAKPDSLEQAWRLCQNRALFARLEAHARRRLLRGV